MQSICDELELTNGVMEIAVLGLIFQPHFLTWDLLVRTVPSRGTTPLNNGLARTDRPQHLTQDVCVCDGGLIQRGSEVRTHTHA